MSKKDLKIRQLAGADLYATCICGHVSAVGDEVIDNSLSQDMPAYKQAIIYSGISPNAEYMTEAVHTCSATRVSIHWHAHRMFES